MTREPREADSCEYRVERGDTIMRRRKTPSGEWSGPWERVAVEATDPLLREALEMLLHAFSSMPDAGLTTGDPRYDWWYRTAPEREHARDALAAAGTEPEWEYRVIYERAGSRRSGPCDLPTAKRYRAQYAGPVDPTGFTGSIERRRKAGEWEALPDAE